MSTNQLSRPILLVEDNPMDVELTLRAFKRHKVTNPVEVARDGEEALSYIQKWDEGEPLPVLMLLDMKLPKIDGLEVLKGLKSHPVYRRIPIVMLTSSAQDQDINAAYEHGANSYVVKPVDLHEFIEVAGRLELYWTVVNKQVE